MAYGGLMLIRSKNKNAFSLIELMIVIAIIGLLAATALPNFSKYKTNAKVTEAYNLLAAIQKGESTYFVENQRYRSMDANPTTINSGGSNTIVQSSSWDAISNPIGAGTQTHFGYVVYAGYLDGSSSEFVVNSDGTTAAAGGYLFGQHASTGSDTCPGTSDTSDVGLSMTAGTDWVIMLATSDMVDGSGSCSIVFQTMETADGATSRSPFIKVNIGE